MTSQRVALAAHDAGLCVVAPKEDGSKAPRGEWKQRQSARPERLALAREYQLHGYSGVGVVTGAVSGNVEALDFDDMQTYRAFKARAQECGLDALVGRIEAGYCDSTPKPGVRWIIRCSEIAGNLKLARRPCPDPSACEEHAGDYAEHADTRKYIHVLIETRGEGGYAIVRGTNGRVHPSGGAYQARAGDFASIPELTPEEREALFDLMRTFDEMPRETAPEPPPAPGSSGLRPGDDFNARADWREVLEPHGWVLVYRRGDEQFWRRPGKRIGISATTNYAGSGLLYVFSSSTAFEPERGYSKFAAYAVLNHGGDFRAAAQALASDGYGERLPELTASEHTGGDAAGEGAATVHPDVARELHSLRVRDEARRIFEGERRAKVDPPEILTLRERLARPLPPVQYRIEGWQPAGSRGMLVAQYKAGKTTLTGNLARCLADGRRWLGTAAVAPVTGTVTIIDTEMSPRQLDAWLADQGIERDDRVVVISLRGRVSTFNILDDDVRAWWAERLRGTEYLIIDCLRPILDALGLDENREAGRVLTAIDALLEQAGIPDAMVVQHMGHQNERARGDSRFRDWPDFEWRLVRESDEPNSARFISAYGRDVEVAETKLYFDMITRHLTLSEGSRKDVAALAALDAIIEVLTASPDPLSGRAIEREMADSDYSRETIRRALKVGIAGGRLSRTDGPKRSVLYQCASAPECADSAPGALSECASAPIERRTHYADDGGSVRGFEDTPDDVFDRGAVEAGAILNPPRDWEPREVEL